MTRSSGREAVLDRLEGIFRRYVVNVSPPRIRLSPWNAIPS